MPQVLEQSLFLLVHLLVDNGMHELLLQGTNRTLVIILNTSNLKSTVFCSFSLWSTQKYVLLLHILIVIFSHTGLPLTWVILCPIRT